MQGLGSSDRICFTGTCRNIFALWKEQYQQMELLRAAVEGLAEEISLMKMVMLPHFGKGLG